MSPSLRPAFDRLGFVAAGRALKSRHRRLQRHVGTRWALARSSSADERLARLDPELWSGSLDWAQTFEDAPKPDVIQQLRKAAKGGGGDVRVLHFLTRLLRPEVAVETGVAAGWSTVAILTAMEENGFGQLWSSDLTYERRGAGRFDLDPGVLVPDRLRNRWTLLTEGDEVNIPEILRAVRKIDLVHYDSDKSVRGRRSVFSEVVPRLRSGAVIVVDDIGDNGHFRSLWRSLRWPGCVLQKGTGHVGILTHPESSLSEALDAFPGG